MDGWTDGGRDGATKGVKEGGREVRREGGREGWREGRREGGREGGEVCRKGGREGGSEGWREGRGGSQLWSGCIYNLEWVHTAYATRAKPGNQLIYNRPPTKGDASVCLCAQFDQFLPVRSHFDTKHPVHFFT